MSFRPIPILHSCLISNKPLSNTIMICFTPIRHNYIIECILSDSLHSIHAFIPNYLYTESVCVNNVLISGDFVFTNIYSLLITEITVLSGSFVNCVPMNVNFENDVLNISKSLMINWVEKAEKRDKFLSKVDAFSKVENKICNEDKCKGIENLNNAIEKSNSGYAMLNILLKSDDCYKMGNYGLHNVVKTKKLRIKDNEIKDCEYCLIKNRNKLNEDVNPNINVEEEIKPKDQISHTEVKYIAYSDTHVIKKTIKLELVDIKTLNLLNYIECDDENDVKNINKQIG